jgi:hypothetical protein
VPPAPPDQFAVGFTPTFNEWLIFTGNGSAASFERWSRTGALGTTGTPSMFGNFVGSQVFPWTASRHFVMVPAGLASVPADVMTTTVIPLTSSVPQSTAVADGGTVGVSAGTPPASRLTFSRVNGNTPALLPGQTLVSPSRTFASALAFDGLRWRLAFLDGPTGQLWLATLGFDGALEQLRPLTCDAFRYGAPAIAAPDPTAVYVTYSNSVASGLLRVP